MTTPAHRLRYVTEGRCVNCGRVRERPGVRCEGCRQRHRTSNTRTYVRLVAAGRCPRCRQAPEEGYVYCPPCCAKAKAWRQRRHP